MPATNFLKNTLLGAALLASSWGAQSAGLGKFTLLSGLGQPLRAEIELVSVQQDEAATLAVRIASPEAYKQANVEYASVLRGIRATLEQRPNGQHLVRLVSAEPVNEPFLDLLVELTWAAGRLVREYTTLVDPPGYAGGATPPAVARTLPAPAAPAVPTPQRESPSAAVPPAAAVARPPVAAPAGKTSYGPVKHGDTLRKIAEGVRRPGEDLNQLLVGLYRQNPEAFDGRNMNRLRTGPILRIPDSAEVAAIPAQQAAREIRSQTSEWQAYRRRLAGAVAEAPEGEAGARASGKVSVAVEDKAAEKPAAKEVLKLSRGETPSAAGAGKETGKGQKTLQEQLRSLEDEAVAREKTLKEANERVAQLEKTIKELQRLVEMKSQGMGALQQQAATQPPVAPPQPKPEAAPAQPKPEAGPASVAPAPAAVAPAPPPPPAPGVVEQLLSEPLYLAAGGGVLLLGALGAAAYRRRRQAVPPPSAPVVSAAAGSEPKVGPDALDPLAEAEMCLAYGREAQAEEVLKDGIAKQPQRLELHAKLSEIYAAGKKVAAFDELAAQLKNLTGGVGAIWAQTLALGYALNPANPLYAAGKTEAEPVVSDTQFLESAKAAGTAEMDLDFNLDLMGAASAEAAPEAVPQQAVDVDLGALSEPASEQAEPATAGVIDFPLEETQPATGAVAPAEPLVPDFSLDLGMGNTQTVPATPPDTGFTSEGTLILQAPVAFEPPSAAPSQQAAPAEPSSQEAGLDFDLGGIDLELPEAPPALAEKGDAGAMMDFKLDLELPADLPSPPSIEDLNLSGLDLDLEPRSGEESVAPERGSHWHEVQTKFDLAKAYQEMGDKDGAREILQEVLREGDDGQRTEAEKLLGALG